MMMASQVGDRPAVSKMQPSLWKRRGRAAQDAVKSLEDVRLSV